MELHICVTHRDGLFHAVRRGNGTWTPLGDVVKAVPKRQGKARPGAIVDVACASPGNAGELHVVVADANNAIWHTLRHPNGQWEPFGSVAEQTLGVNGELVGCADANGELHVVAVSRDQGPYITRSTIRHQNGKWTPTFVPFLAQELMAAAPIGLDLYGVAWSRTLWKTSRTLTGGTFSAPFDVMAATAAENPPSAGQHVRASRVAVAPNTGTGGTHIVVNDYGRPYHSLRTNTGTRFWDLASVSAIQNQGDPGVADMPGNYGGVACASVDGDLHVVLDSGWSPLAGHRLWHTIRDGATGDWLVIRDVNTQVGALSNDTYYDQGDISVSCAGANTVTP